MNTRRYPRTINEAFPFGPEYGCAVEVFERRPRIGRWIALLIVIAIALLSLAGKADDAMQTVADDLQQAPADARLAMKE